MTAYSARNQNWLVAVVVVILLTFIFITRYYTTETDPVQPLRDSAEAKVKAAEVKVIRADSFRKEAVITHENTKKLDKIFHEKATRTLYLPADSAYNRFMSRFGPDRPWH